MENKERTFEEVLEELRQYFYQVSNESASEIIENILKQNNNIEPKEYFLQFFNFLENTIPENVRENFYRNLKKLKIELNLDYDFSIIKDKEYQPMDEIESLRYWHGANKIVVNPEYLKVLIKEISKIGCSIEYLTIVLREKILHELCHMASTYCDKEKRIEYSGFSLNLFESNNIIYERIALTEGMTEAIAWKETPSELGIRPAYPVETLLVIQLMQIVGRNLMLESYFGNKGIIEIEKELDKFGNNYLKSNTLLNGIEISFYLQQERNIQRHAYFVSKIQNILIEYYKNKMLYLIENNLITKEEVENSLAIYEEALIRKETMEEIEITDNIEFYNCLDESIEKFYLVKQEIISMLSSNYTKKKVL